MYLRGICTADKYLVFKWRTVCKAYIFILDEGPGVAREKNVKFFFEFLN